MKMFIDFNAMVHAFLFNTTTNCECDEYFMCREILELLRKKIYNDGQPRVEDNCKKVVVRK
jgi:hypothetical protein